MSKLKIQYLPIEELIPYARNARTHSEEQIAQIAGSIKEFDFNDPIAVDKDKTIIEGHGRVLAAQRLGLKELPVVCLAHLTESQKRAYMLAHNRIALNAGWDREMMAVELTDIRQDGVDLGVLGFDEKDLTDIFGGDDKPEKPGVEIGAMEYRVVVLCKSEEEQSALTDELEERGYKCQLLIS